MIEKMKKIKWILAPLLLPLLASAQGQEKLLNGQWRGELLRSDNQRIVFNFEVHQSAGKLGITLRNAEERLAVDEIETTKDSIFIKLPFFDSEFRAAFSQKDRLQGSWITHLADKDAVMPFVAIYTGKKYERFKAVNKKPAGDISGRWATSFINPANGKETKAIGVFEQKGKKLTGSFITPSGDYRYLEGVVDGDSLKFSGFDGGYAIYFTAHIRNNNQIDGGKYYSANGPLPRTWTAERDPLAELPDNLSATRLKSGASPRLSFTFPDTDRNLISINDARFKNKVVLVQVLGSWCPNCMDESVFLNEIYSTYSRNEVEIIGLAYERSADFDRSKQSVLNFMKRLHVEYPVLLTSVAANDPENAEKTLPQLDKILIFPTTVFIDRKGEIQKILTGFNGPGTGAEYDKQKKLYKDIIEGLLNR